MMTYDDTDSVRAMAAKRGFSISRIPMKGTHHKETYELIVTPAGQNILQARRIGSM